MKKYRKVVVHKDPIEFLRDIRCPVCGSKPKYLFNQHSTPDELTVECHGRVMTVNFNVDTFDPSYDKHALIRRGVEEIMEAFMKESEVLSTCEKERKAGAAFLGDELGEFLNTV